MPVTKKAQYLRDILCRYEGQLDRIASEYLAKPSMFPHYNEETVQEFRDEIETLIEGIREVAGECSSELRKCIEEPKKNEEG